MPPSFQSAKEDELLLLLVHGRHSPDRDARIRALLGASPDWPALLRQASRHGVVPLVAHHLQQLGSPGVPAAVATELQRQALLHLGAIRSMSNCRVRRWR